MLLSQQLLIHHHTGGLENNKNPKLKKLNIHHHTGGLENCFLLLLQLIVL
jgi:hypothetical protein